MASRSDTSDRSPRVTSGSTTRPTAGRRTTSCRSSKTQPPKIQSNWTVQRVPDLPAHPITRRTSWAPCCPHRINVGRRLILASQGRCAFGPRQHGLELSRQAEQHLLARRRPDQLYGGGQAIRALIERERDRRLPRHVDDRREGREVARPAEVGHRVSAETGHLTHGHWAARQRRREQDVVIRQRGDDRARRGLEPGICREVLDRVLRERMLVELPGERLDVLEGRLAPGELTSQPRAQRYERPERAHELREQVEAQPWRIDSTNVMPE